jgi:hypothetical protein
VKHNPFEASLHGPEAHAIVPETEITATLTPLKGYRTMFRKCYGALQFNLFCSCSSVLARHVTNRILCHLGRKTKAGANITIHKPVQVYGIGKASLSESPLADVIARRRPRLNSALRCGYIQIKSGFSRAYNFHTKIILHYLLLEKLTYGGREFPCRLKSAVPFA